EWVGPVAARPGCGGWLSWPTLLAALLSLGAGAAALAAWGGRRSWRAIGWYSAAATLFGVAAYGDLRSTARDATDRWLGDGRLLIQEAVARLPATRTSLATLAAIARAAEPGAGGGRAGGGAGRPAV